ncbi:MAG: hypothetical protein AAB486_04880 [Patescibacteria group bacterium]
MSNGSVQIGYIGEDRDFFQKIENLFPRPTDNNFMVDVAEAERTPTHFDVGPFNLIIVDWQFNVQAAISPARLANFIREYARRGFRVAVVVADDLFTQTMIGICMEAGACSMFIKELSDYDLNRWVTRLMQLPLRGPWAEKVVFP